MTTTRYAVEAICTELIPADWHAGEHPLNTRGCVWCWSLNSMPPPRGVRRLVRRRA